MTSVLTSFSLFSPEVWVLKGIPGSGKSHQTREAIKAMIDAGELRRVLWAVQSTVKDDSFGAETMAELAALGISSQVILGKKHLSTSPGAYEAQMPWKPEVPVKIISHAHLALLWELDASRCPYPMQPLYEGVQLLIVDENPYSSLIESNGESKTLDGRPARKDITLDALKRLLTSKPKSRKAVQHSVVMNRLKNMLEQLELHTLPGETLHGANKLVGEIRGVHGETFWKHLSGHWKRPMTHTEQNEELKHLQDDFAKLGHPEWVARELLTDLNSFLGGGGSSLRFGMVAGSRDKRATHPWHLRYDVTAVRKPQIPTLILDAYANQEFYQQLLGAPVNIVQLENEPYKLPVLHLPQFKVSSLNYTQNRATKHLRTVLRETLHRFREDKDAKLLFLVPQNAVTTVQRLWKELQDQYGTKLETEFNYWYKGRGKNTWTGHHVIAFEVNHLPVTLESHMLTALYRADTPEDSDRRTHLRTRLQSEELLQMLHRGRHYRNPDVKAVLYGELTENLQSALKEQVEFHQPAPHYAFESNSKNQDVRDTLVDHCPEVHQLLGGIPKHVLVLLGIYAPQETNPALMAEREHRLQERIEDAIKSGMHLPMLEHWARHKRPCVLPDFKPRKGWHIRSKLEDFICHTVPGKQLQPHEIRFKSTQHTVYAENEAAASARSQVRLFAPLRKVYSSQPTVHSERFCSTYHQFTSIIREVALGMLWKPG
ncbi:hypothetical protein [Deinococcus roseus]|uniref:hypothetical protein n=1 Tax=Deinococcus roseus TaxID=392414 RepID=UPI00166C270C|nr:hypothetical protein [Deinococcus roseus]